MASRACYSGSPANRLSGRLARLTAVVLLAGLSPHLGGCAYRLDSLFHKDADPAIETTGSIVPAVKSNAIALPSGDPASDADLAYARAAAAVLMDNQGKGTAQPWENPQTGSRGMVTPLAEAYDDQGLKCRDFLASYVRGRTETWLQGDACQFAGGKWEVRTMKPWKRT
jgi:surface antigen